MRLLFWRKPKPSPDKPSTAPAPSATPTAKAPARRKAQTPPSEPSAALDFARTYLQAVGARTTAASPSTLSAHLPDGREIRYTASPADAPDDPASEVLLPGGPALTAMLDDVAARARLVAFRLPRTNDLDAAVKKAFAPPAKNCARCLTANAEPLDTCDACPLLSGAHVLGGLGRITSTHLIREWEEVSIEMAFTITAHDHYGRVDDLVRIALDASGAALPLVPEAALARAEDHAVQNDADGQLSAALPHARRDLERRTNAVAAFLRLRGAADYARRRDEVTGAFTAMQAEPDADRAALTRALNKELTRLADVYGADVTAQLASTAFITTTMAEVEVKEDARHILLATLDLGRGTVRSSTWDAPEGSAAPSAPTTSAPARRSTAKDASLTTAALDLLPPAAYAACLRWLLERTGAIVSSSHETLSGHSFQGIRNGRPLVVLALTIPNASALSARDVRLASALASAPRDAATLLIGARPASEAAQAEAQRLSVELWDRATLDTLLAEQTGTHERAAKQRTADIEARIALAVEIRTQVIQAVEAMEAALAEPRTNEKLRMQSKVTTAVAAIEQGKLTTLRSLLACQTLVADLRAAFGERPARDGSLEIVAATTALTDLRARIQHLKPLAITAAREIADQPTTGDFGYSAWRKVVAEELTARCESVRWRALSLDPAKWRDYGKALDAQAATQADVSTATAERAAARATHLAGEINARAVPSS